MAIAIGGTAYATSQLPKNSVGTKQLQKNAVTGTKVKDKTLTGADINLAKLGRVPSAKNAAHATSANSATTAGHATNAEHATNADHSSSADQATNASHATNADSATNATTAASLQGFDPNSVWKRGGNAQMTPGTDFLGTTDNKALELKVNSARALRLEPDATSPNVIGGFSGNSVTAGKHGATIGGGGQIGAGDTEPNAVTGDFGTIAGGEGNMASGDHSTVSGGGGIIDNPPPLPTTQHLNGNTASGGHSTVAGGEGNTASGDKSIVGGGGGSNDPYASGGCACNGNKASGHHSAVLGGQSNRAASVIGGHLLTENPMQAEGTYERCSPVARALTAAARSSPRGIVITSDA